MKQNNYLRRILSALLLLMASSLAWAQYYDFAAENADGVTLYYNLINDGKEAEVVYPPFDRSIIYAEVIRIPETVQYYGKKLSVTSIGDEAFAELDNLTLIDIPESVTSIGFSAFSGCSSLTSVIIGNGVTSIRGSAFSYCPSLTSVIIGNGVTSIGDWAFYGCSALTSIDIPDGVTSIGSSAFGYCSSLTSVIIGNGVTSIGGSAFGYCSSLTSVIIGNGVTSIGYYTFTDCKSLESIMVSADNPIYDSREGCNAIIETATNTLIFGCKNTIIPDGVTSIGTYAFSYCSSLTSIDIPASVTSIGLLAIDGRGCESLESITVSADNPIYDSREGCNAIIETASNMLKVGCKGTIIPESVTSIGRNAFYYCMDLTSIDIPGSVTRIEGEAFYDCYSLATVICRAENVPELGDYAFSAVPTSEATLYVPAFALEAYKTADQWKDFGTILPLEEAEEAVTLFIGDAHYATFIAPFDVKIPANVTAYTVSGIKEDGETLQMDELTRTIPANTPVVLYSNDMVDETVTGIRTTQETTYTHGLLTGVYTEIQAPADSYVLQNQNGEVAFYYVAEGSQPAVKANRAYLTVPNANGIKAFRFGIDDETTGIQATVGDQESKGVIYDMTGRRVEKAVKGMYIIDGKKVMVK